jgi:2'-5' RNA ligase
MFDTNEALRGVMRAGGRRFKSARPDQIQLHGATRPSRRRNPRIARGRPTLRGIISSSTMSVSRYALVAYVRKPVGEFVETLRRDLRPELPHMAAHLTILPPRLLQGSESAAIHDLEEICRDVEPFEVSLGEVETFIPVTPTVFIRVAHAAARMQELHDRLNRDALCCTEQLPYIPHLTIAKMGTEELAWKGFEVARRRWARYPGSRHIPLEELTFVREDEHSRWVDLAPVPLGRSLASRKK